MRFRTLYTIVLLLIFTGAYPPLQAQEVISRGGRFKVDFGIGCAPLPVNVTNLFTGFSGAPQYDYEFDGDFLNANLVLDTFHTYQAAGTYTLLQEGPQITNSLIDSVDIAVLEPLDPEFSVSACANNSAKVLITDTYYDRFRVFYTPLDSFDVVQGEEVPGFSYPGPGTYDVSVEGFFDGGKENCGLRTVPFTTGNDTIAPAELLAVRVATISGTNGEIVLEYSTSPGTVYRLERTNPNRTSPFIEVGLITDPQTITVSGLNTSEFFYCFRVVAFDACSGQSIASNTVCSTVISGTAEEGRNILNWNTGMVDFAGYDLQKDSLVAQTFSSFSSKSYEDADIRCNQQVCYTVTTNYSQGPVSISGTVCLDAISGTDPPPIDNLTASYNDGDVSLDWESTGGSYAIFRYVGRGPRVFLDSTSVNAYVDPNVDPEERPCYWISYRDACGNESDLGIRACVVQVRRSSELLNLLELAWTDYEGWSEGVDQYIVQELNEQGAVINETAVGTSRVFSDEIDEMGPQSRFFRVRSESRGNSSFISFSPPLEIKLESRVFLPNAFAPNGLNNRLEVNTYFVTQYEMRIFNRWGELIHLSDQDSPGWDGRVETTGRLAPTGSYLYRVNFKDGDDNSLESSGMVTLIR